MKKKHRSERELKAIGMENLFELARDVLVVTDNEGRWMALSSSCKRIWGYTRDELIGTYLHNLVLPEDLDSTKAQLDSLNEGREVLDFQNRYRHKDGSVVWMEWRAVFDKETGTVSAIGRDITERKKLQEEAERNQRQIVQAQKLESLGMLAGGIAHDFNNILVGVMGNADIVREYLEPGSEAEECIDDVVTASHRAAQLCGQLLNYAGKGLSI